MLPDKLKLEIITPMRVVYSGDVASVRVPGKEGSFGVFPGHTPFLASMKIGEIKAETADRSEHLATTGGIAEITPDSVTILAETAEAASEIDAERAESARRRAADKIRDGRQRWNIDRAHISLLRAINRITIASTS